MYNYNNNNNKKNNVKTDNKKKNSIVLHFASITYCRYLYPILS